MPTAMLDRLQENKLRGLEELIESCKAASMVGGQDQTAAIADFIVDEGIGMRQGLLRFWDFCWTEALAGHVPDRSLEGASIRSLLHRGADCLTRAAAVARQGASVSGLEVARLALFEEQVQAFPAWVAECIACWEQLDGPRRPLNRQRLAAAREAFVQGACEDAENIVARVGKGGAVAEE